MARSPLPSVADELFSIVAGPELSRSADIKVIQFLDSDSNGVAATEFVALAHIPTGTDRH